MTTARFTLRAARRDDLAAVARLVIENNLAEIGEADFSEADLESEWGLEHFDIARNTIVAEDDAGGLVGYAWFLDREPRRDYDADVTVHPGVSDPALEDALFERIEQMTEAHAREGAADSAGALLHVPRWKHMEEACRRIASRGFEPIRWYSRMAITLDGPVEVPAPPGGLTIRACRRGQDEGAFYDVLHVAFRDHYRFKPMSKEDWVRRHTHEAFYRPELWFLALDGDRPVGALVTLFYEGDVAWIDELGVLESHRGRRVGRALLLRAFEAIRAAGQPRVLLGVDADNATGATQLYERVGMTLNRQATLYRKTIARG